MTYSPPVLRVCYVLVCSGWDRHAQMAWLSATSVRIQEPRARIVVVYEGVSAETDAVLETRFANLADDLIRKSSDAVSPVGKNRMHRIALREYVSGDFLYMDSDTLAIAPIGDVLGYPGDVGAVMDFNHDPSNPYFPPNLEEPFQNLGWDYPLPRYLNTGVILMRDTPACREFCHEWRRRFETPNTLPHVWDQASFVSALFATAVPHVVLPNGFNAIVVKRNYRFRQSRILHFFGSPDEQRGTILEHLLLQVAETGAFDRRAYDRCIRESHPWGPRPEPWQLRHSRNYVRAARALAARTLRRMRG